MKRTRTVLLIAVLLAAGPAAARAQSGAASAKPLSDYYSDSTLLYVECPSIPAFVEGSKSTGLYALYHDDTFAAIRALIEDKAQEAGAEGSWADTFGTVRDFASSLPGAISFGLRPFEESPEWLLVAQVTGAEQEARRLLDVINSPSYAGGRASTVVEIGGVKATLAGNGVVYSTVVDSMMFAGSKQAFTTALGRRNTRTSEGSLSSNVNFLKARSFQSSPTPAYSAVVIFPEVWKRVKDSLPSTLPFDFEGMLGMLGIDDIDTLSLEGAFQYAGVVEHVYISTKTADSELINLLASEPFDETRLSMVPRNAFIVGGKSADITVGYDVALKLLKEITPMIGIDAGGMLEAFEERTGLSVEEDILPAIGKNSVTYMELPDSFSLMSMATGGGFSQVSLIEVDDEDKVSEMVDKLVNIATTDPTFLSSLTPPGSPPPQILTATLGDMKIHYLAMPGVPVGLPAVTVAQGYLIYGDSKDTVKTAVDRLIAPGPSLMDSADYRKVRAALAKPAVQLTYVNFDRLIDVAYNNIMPMVGPQMDSAYNAGTSPLSSSDIPPTYVVKKHLDGVGMSLTTAGNVIDIQAYSPAGGAVLMLASVASLLPREKPEGGGAFGGIPGGGDMPEESGMSPERAQLFKIGGMLQIATVERKGKFPDTIDEVVPREMLQAPQDPSPESEIDYVYVPGYTTSSPGARVLVYERKGLAPDGRHVLLVDGRVEFVSESEFEEMIATTDPDGD